MGCRVEVDWVWKGVMLSLGRRQEDIVGTFGTI